METLVIHPKDETTDFLKYIYQGKNYTVITERGSNSKLRKLINEHDRIIMLGHGCDKGLFGHDCLMIDANFVQFLRNKECIGIWCHARDFFYKYGLTGFCSGMFISDYMEANMYAVKSHTTEIDLSNISFAKAVGKHLFNDGYYELIKSEYEVINEVTEFNNNSLYKFPLTID